jgi:dienelactone hydrolase
MKFSVPHGFRLERRVQRSPRAPALHVACLLLVLCSESAASEMRLPYHLSRPGGNGPFPAVVILHDCSGLGPRSSGAPWRWASELTARGYVSIWPDSFVSRGRTTGVCTDASPPRVTHQQRADDAYEALSYLRSLPFVQGRRVAVMGGSHGGSSTLATIVDAPANAARGKSGFAAAIALYPNCARSLGGWSVERKPQRGGPTFAYAGAFKPLAPLLILIGELDDWTPAEPCRKLAEAAQSAGYPVTTKVYPGAHHSFDSLGPVRYVGERINANSPTGRGATTAGHAEAWADAILQVGRFLAQHMMK